MTQASVRYKSEDREEYTPSGSAYVPGTPVELASGLVGIGPVALADGEPGELDVNGRFTGRKITAQAWDTIGAAVYWDTTATAVTGETGAYTTVDPTTNGFQVGVVAAPLAGATDPTGTIRLNGK